MPSMIGEWSRPRLLEDFVFNAVDKITGDFMLSGFQRERAANQEGTRKALEVVRVMSKALE